ncbi:MAG: membrane protein insertion efficiency factor YidD [Alphaproteobacteria bacterium]|nr:membrane protein insertion efficiency factor YidD [Alphaproteobacteria bacterium]
MIRSVLHFVLSFLVLLPVHVYRLFISPMLGPRCRFQPTCSEYAVEAVRVHGAWAGLWLSLKRLSHCHPIEALCARHGFDPVPVEIYRAAWYAPWRIKAREEHTET